MLSSVPVSITVSPQTAAILIAILIIILASLLFTRGKRSRHRAEGRKKAARMGKTATVHKQVTTVETKRTVAKRRIDFGANIAKEHGHTRSPQWARVEREHRLREPACVVCGYAGKGVQVHHIKPFHLHPDLELDPKNLITLCELPGRDHHLLIGHLDAWGSYNVNVRADAKHYYGWTEKQIREHPEWLKRVAKRP